MGKSSATKQLEVIFVGFLANCDESIVGVDLEDGFEIKKISFDDGLALLKQLERGDEGIIYSKYITQRIITGFSKPIFWIQKRVSTKFTRDATMSTENIQECHSVSTNLHNEAATVLRNKLRLMRLFKEGNILMPVQFTYIDGQNPIRLSSGYSLNIVQIEPYHLEVDEKDELRRFISSVRLPFEDKSLKIAFDSFELSYDTNHNGLSLVSSIVALECLLSDGGSEKSYKLSRNLAVLLGSDSDSSKKIFRDMKRLYRKRSNMVHDGEMGVTSDDVHLGRIFARAAIKRYLLSNLSKSDLLDSLNSTGFSESRAW